jgi:hypothetical protein
MGNECSVQGLYEDDVHIIDRINRIANDFFMYQCEVSGDTHLHIMILLQHFQKYASTQLSPYDFEIWTSMYTPYTRISMVLDVLPDTIKVQKHNNIISGICIKNI